MHSVTTGKRIIYQIFTRLFGNRNTRNLPHGTLTENGTGKFNDITEEALGSLVRLGITDVWYTGVIHHAQLTDYTQFGIPADHPSIVKGIAGSPYAVKDYYDVDPDLAVHVPERMKEFEELIERTHRHNLKVIIDFVPNHVARQYKSACLPEGIRDLGQDDQTGLAFHPDNNFYYLPGEYFTPPAEEQNPDMVSYYEYPAKATGNDVFAPAPHINDWYETIKLNYGVDYLNGHQRHFDPIPSTWHKMKDILLYWAEKKVDGFRCDMAEMVPAEFWGWAISEVKRHYPQVIFIAEIYNAALYHRFIEEGKFDYLYDKVGLYNHLRPLTEGHGNAENLTWLWQNESGSISANMLRFMENHDEQRIASRFFAGNPFSALPAVALCATFHTGPFMIYFGQELGVNPQSSEGFQGDDGRTTIFDYWGVPEIQQWMNDGRYDEANLSADQIRLRRFYAALCHLALNSRAISTGHFYDLQYVNNNGQSSGYNASRIYSFLRYTQEEQLLCMYNFDHETHYETFLKIPLQVMDDLLGFKNDADIKLITIFTSHEKIQEQIINKDDVSNSGIKVSLPPDSVHIFRFSK